MNRTIKVKPVTRTDIDGFEAEVRGVGLHPADGRLVVSARSAQYAGGRFLGYLFLRLHEQPDGSWVNIHVPPKVAEFLANAEPGSRQKVSGRWWSTEPQTKAPNRIVYR